LTIWLSKAELLCHPLCVCSLRLLAVASHRSSAT